MARREARIVDGAVLGGRTPIRICSFELVLIMQHVAGGEAQTNEINLKLILIGGEVGQADVAFAERGERLL